MEKNNSEFDKYINVLKENLSANQTVIENICLEVRNAIEDKYSECVSMGCENEMSIRKTLESFEDPRKLAEDFNKVYKEKLGMKNSKENILNLAARAFSDVFLTGGMTAENCKAVLHSQTGPDKNLTKIHIK